MIIPASSAIDETGRVNTSDQIRETELRIAFNHLTPAFVVDYLKGLLVAINLKPLVQNVTHVPMLG
jgi:hypothetical protein